MQSLLAQALCGFDEMHERLLSADAKYRTTVKANNEAIRKYLSNHPLGSQNAMGVLYTIPVVIHVVNTGDTIGSIYNPTDAQIAATLAYVNSIYNGTNAGLAGGVGDMQIQFVLAKRDPLCNRTNGIDRVNGSSIPDYTASGINYNNTNGATQLSVKNFARWDPANYYNIWVVNKIDGLDGTVGQYTAGFAYFPGGSSSYDGTVILATQMKINKKTLPHELGHALNLYHTFQGSSGVNSCPSNTDCSLNGDLVCDTDPIPYNVTNGVVDFTCRTGANPCTGLDYTINTERNFMSYTSCYTLFTQGQKERALAAMTLPARVTLANSPAAKSCYANIDFATSQFTVAETTTGTDGCRNYTDYTITLTIDNDPLEDAIVSFQLGGIATNITDYEITTNGSFSRPSTQLIFPAGLHNSQSFTLRVYNDASVESQETIIIDFTIGNGGTYTIKGLTNPTFTVKINDNDAAPAPYGATATTTVGSNTYTGFYHPFRSGYKRARTQAIYLAAELQAAGLSAGSSISKIGMKVNVKNSATPYTGFNISMKNTLLNDFRIAVFETGLINVFSGSFSTVTGMNTITLNSPFVWDGASNIVIDFCYDNTVSTDAGKSDYISSTISSDYSRCIWNRDSVGSGCLMNAFYSNVSGVGYPKPDITFTAQLGTPVATALSTTKIEYLGPYADIYFKDTSNKILARIKNLTSFDYGCTAVTIDRAGAGAIAFQSNDSSKYLTAKTITITPDRNNPLGQFETTLYYTAGEMQGWQAATGFNFNIVQLIKTDGPIAAVTPDNPSASGPVTVVNTSNNAFGNDRTMTGTFSGNLGSFGAGFLISRTYTFIGNGNWTDAANWANATIPPAILPSGEQIVIQPVADGECIVDTEQTILQGSMLTIQPGKKMRLLTNLNMK